MGSLIKSRLVCRSKRHVGFFARGKVLVHANEEPDVRSAEITLKSSVQNYTIQVRQLGYGPAILVKNPNPIIDAAGGPLSIIVTSNIEYTIEQSENSDWIKTVPATRALTDKEYQYTVDANPYYETRTVTFTYIYTKDDKIRALCSVTQNAKDSGVSDVEIEGDLKISPNGGKIVSTSRDKESRTLLMASLVEPPIIQFGIKRLIFLLLSNIF